jgi:hypothetical protein
MNINEKDLLALVAVALSVGNGNDRAFAKVALHAAAIKIYEQSGFTREQVEEVINKI